MTAFSVALVYVTSSHTISIIPPMFTTRSCVKCRYRAKPRKDYPVEIRLFTR